MELGYAFWWPAFGKPIVTRPDGGTVVLEVENYVPFLDSTAYSCGAKTKDTLFRQFAAVSAVPQKPHPASSGHTGAGVPVCVGGPGDAGADPIALPPPAVAGPDVAVVEDDDARHNLKLEALSLEHLLTHFPKNKYCSACQRARLRRRPIGVVRQDKGEAAVEFGDVITCDHIIASKDEAEGLLTDKTAMTIYDMGTHFTGCYPLKTKGADDAYRALQHFRGPRGTFHYVYSDNSGEIWKAVDMLGFPQGTSTPGIHETNSHIERRNETILGGTRTVLECWLSELLLATCIGILLPYVEYQVTRGRQRLELATQDWTFQGFAYSCWVRGGLHPERHEEEVEGAEQVDV